MIDPAGRSNQIDFGAPEELKRPIHAGAESRPLVLVFGRHYHHHILGARRPPPPRLGSAPAGHAGAQAQIRNAEAVNTLALPAAGDAGRLTRTSIGTIW